MDDVLNGSQDHDALRQLPAVPDRARKERRRGPPRRRASARLASAASSLFRAITRPWPAMRRLSPAATRDLPAGRASDDNRPGPDRDQASVDVRAPLAGRRDLSWPLAASGTAAHGRRHARRVLDSPAGNRKRPMGVRDTSGRGTQRSRAAASTTSRLSHPVSPGLRRRAAGPRGALLLLHVLLQCPARKWPPPGWERALTCGN